MKNLVIFDFDGVIVNTFPVSYGFYEEYAPGEVEIDDYRTWYNGNIYDSLAKKEAAKKLPPYDEYFRLYAQRIAKLPLAPGIATALAQLDPAYYLSVVSSSDTAAINQYLELREVRHHFDEILGSDVAASKVHKIERLLTDHDVGAEHALMITDTLGDIREAEKVGVRSVAVTWGFQKEDNLSQGQPLAILSSGDDIVPVIKRYFGEEGS